MLFGMKENDWHDWHGQGLQISFSTQPPIACSKLIIKTLELCVKYVRS